MAIPDNPLGHYRLSLSTAAICPSWHQRALGRRHEYQPRMRAALSGGYRTAVQLSQSRDAGPVRVSAGQIRLARRSLYVEVHDDLYGNSLGFGIMRRRMERLGPEDSVDSTSWRRRSPRRAECRPMWAWSKSPQLADAIRSRISQRRQSRSRERIPPASRLRRQHLLPGFRRALPNT